MVAVASHEVTLTDDSLPDADPAANHVVEQVPMLEETRSETKQLRKESEAVQQYLRDKIKVKDGEAPEGWEQPSLDAYLEQPEQKTMVPSAIILHRRGPVGVPAALIMSPSE